MIMMIVLIMTVCIGPCDLIPAGLKDHVTLGLPPFSDDKWWSPVIAMATCKPIISLHVSQVSIILSIT